MAVVYFDASALVKLFLDEHGSDLAATLWDECDIAATSLLTYPEVCAALAAAERNRDASAPEITEALARWNVAWERLRVVELTSELAVHAGELAREHQLGGADAVHLASALLLEPAGVVLAAWDRRLHSGAAGAGLAVAPDTLSTTPSVSG